MRHALYLVIFLGLTSQMISQTYSGTISDSLIENFVIWEIDHSSKHPDESKLWNRKIAKKIIPWEEALISLLGSAGFPNSFENQYQQLLSQDKSWTLRYGNDLKYISELLSESDIKFLKLQFDSNGKDAQWTFKTSKFNIKNNPRKNFYSYTIPLFNKSHNIAILYKEFFCGSACAEGRILIYVLENNHWRLYKDIPCWIS